MGKQIYAITVFAGLALAAVLIGVFGFFFNTGTLTVIARAPYTIDVEKIFQHCITDLCSVELAPGLYKVAVLKEGYAPADIAAVIKRMRTSEYAVQLKFIPVVRELAPDAQIPVLESAVGFSLDPEGVLKNADMEQITVFPDPPGKDAVILAQDNHLIVYELLQGGMFAYHVDTAARRKTRVLMQEGIMRAMWGPYPWVIFDGDDADDIFALNVENGLRQELPAYPVQHFSSVGDALLFADFANDALSFFQYDFDAQEMTKLAELSGAGTIPNEYARAENGMSLYFRIGKIWRELIIGE